MPVAWLPKLELPNENPDEGAAVVDEEVELKGENEKPVLAGLALAELKLDQNENEGALAPGVAVEDVDVAGEAAAGLPKLNDGREAEVLEGAADVDGAALEAEPFVAGLKGLALLFRLLVAGAEDDAEDVEAVFLSTPWRCFRY